MLQKPITPAEQLRKSIALYKAGAKGGPFIGPRGGKWADAAHTIHWEPGKPKAAPKAARLPDEPDEYDFGFWPLIKRGMTIKQAEAVIKQSATEHLLATDESGRQLVRVHGTVDQCLLSPHDIALLKSTPGVVLTHNHPSSNPLSEEDILLCMLLGLQEIRAVATDGTVYSMSRPPHADIRPLDSTRTSVGGQTITQERWLRNRIAGLRTEASWLANRQMDEWMKARGWAGPSADDPLSHAPYLDAKVFDEFYRQNSFAHSKKFVETQGWVYKRIRPPSEHRGNAAKRDTVGSERRGSAKVRARGEAAQAVAESVAVPGLSKAQRGPFIGPRGGKWADPQHTIHYEDAPSTKRGTATQHTRDVTAREAHVAGATKALKALMSDPTVLAGVAVAKRHAKAQRDSVPYQIAKGLKANKHVQAYLDKWVGPPINSHVVSWRATTIYAMRDHFAGKELLRDTVAKISTQASKGWQAAAMAVSQAPLRAAVPAELLAYLPKNLVVDADPDGKIASITDRFENEHFTLDRKIAKMRWLVANQHAIKAQVQADLSAPTEETRLAALVTSIVMETGIRPGKEGNAMTKKNEAGEVEVIDTFGAITLELDHAQIHADHIDLVFTGKKGTTNRATVRNPAVVEALRRRVVQASEAGRQRLFVDHKGKAFDYTALQRYFGERFGSVIAPTDFRKLRATQETFEALKAEQAALYARIRAIKHTAAVDVKAIVAQEIARTLEAAFARAQSALSHDSATTTRESYINPEVVFHLLSQGRLADDLHTAIVGGARMLKFNPEAFIVAAREAGLAKSAAVLRITAQLARKLEHHVAQS